MRIDQIEFLKSLCITVSVNSRASPKEIRIPSLQMVNHMGLTRV